MGKTIFMSDVFVQGSKVLTEDSITKISDEDKAEILYSLITSFLDEGLKNEIDTIYKMSNNYCLTIRSIVSRLTDYNRVEELTSRLNELEYKHENWLASHDGSLNAILSRMDNLENNLNYKLSYNEVYGSIESYLSNVSVDRIYELIYNKYIGEASPEKRENYEALLSLYNGNYIKTVREIENDNSYKS